MTVVALLAAVGAPSIAKADFWSDFFGQPKEKSRPTRPIQQSHRPASHSHDSEPDEPSRDTIVPTGPLTAVISISSQKVAIYDSTGAVMHARVSTGQSGHRTPFGVFSVIEKAKYHESNIYSGAPMPFMQRITWSGIAMHAGYLPGYPASHGCIRMPEDFASKLFTITQLGMHVVVSPRDTEALPISHPALPVPRMETAPDDDAAVAEISPKPARIVTGSISTNSLSTNALPAGIEPEAAPPNLLNPHQRAVRDRASARKAAVDATKAETVALEASHQASAAANRALDDLHRAAAALASIGQQLASARAQENSSKTPEAQATATAETTNLVTLLAGAQKQFEDVQVEEATRSREAFAAADAWRQADATLEITRRAAKVADKSVEPLSIFVSRKAGRVYVRQGFTPMFDAAVTFKGADPIGTHLFTAVAAEPSTGHLNWMAVSVPNSEPSDQPPATLTLASEALSRVEIAPEVMQKLNDRIWLGGSLIISDAGLGDETGDGTDFVVLTH